jgi:hypothetical protein
MSTIENSIPNKPDSFGTGSEDISNIGQHVGDRLMQALLNDVESIPSTFEIDCSESEYADARAGTTASELTEIVATDSGVARNMAMSVPYPGQQAVAAAVKKSRVVANIPLAGYVFPTLKMAESYASVSNQELDAAHTKLCEKTFSRGAQLPYPAVREQYCSLSIAMNERGLRPPRLRQACQGKSWKPGEEWTDEMKAMSNDMKIIELHWLHRSGLRSLVKDYQFRELFQSNVFDFELATEFVFAKWKAETRATRILHLSDVQQWQVSKLASAEVNKKWVRILDEASDVELHLKNAACRKPLLSNEVDDFTRLWIADAVCAGAPQRLIGIVHGWLKGEAPLAAGTLSAKLKRMRHWTTNSLA